MPALLAKLIPFRDWLYLAAFVAIVAWGFYERSHLIAEGQAHELETLKTSSDKLNLEADAKITALIAKHQADIDGIEATYATQHQTDSDAHSADLERLREYDTYRRQHPPVGRACPGQPAHGPGDSGTGRVVDRVTELEQVASQLADAGRGLNEALTACLADRASLTGK